MTDNRLLLIALAACALAAGCRKTVTTVYPSPVVLKETRK